MPGAAKTRAAARAGGVREELGLTPGTERTKVRRVAPSGGESQSEVRTRNLRTQQRA
jgi:hypothetical protein